MLNRRLNRLARPFFSVSFGHFVVDIFASMGTVLIVFVSAHVLKMTNTQIGFALSGFALCGSLSMPLFGWLGDRTGGRWLGAGGVLWLAALMVISMALAQATHNYLLTVIPFALSAFGSAAFHPIGAMHASEVSHARAASNTSIFFMTGYIGGGIGPLLAGFLLDRSLVGHTAPFAHLLGPALSHQLVDPGNPLPAAALIALFCLPASLMMAWSLPSRSAHVERRVNDHATGDIHRRRPVRRWTMRLIALFILIVALRGMVNPGAVAFLPALFQSKGWDATQYGLIASLASVGAGLAGLGLGTLADRFDARYLIALALILAVPLIFTISLLPAVPAFVAALLIGALSGGPQSLVVLMAQDLLPGRKGLASGSIMGLMFALGAFGTLLVGRLADVVGMDMTYRAVAVVTLIAGLLALALPAEQAQSAAAPVVEPDGLAPAEYELGRPSA